MTKTLTAHDVARFCYEAHRSAAGEGLPWGELSDGMRGWWIGMTKETLGKIRDRNLRHGGHDPHALVAAVSILVADGVRPEDE